MKGFNTILFFVLISFLGALSLTSCEDDPAPPENVVSFCVSSNGGSCQDILLEEINSGSCYSLESWTVNDQVESIRWDLPAGVKVVVYQDFPCSGRSITLEGSGFLDLNEEGLADQLSSFAEQ